MSKESKKVEFDLDAAAAMVKAVSFKHTPSSVVRDTRRSGFRQLARKRVSDPWARLRKMYFGFEEVTALPNGSVYNTLKEFLVKEEKQHHWRAVEADGLDIEARCKRADHLRGLLTSLFIEGCVLRDGVEHLVVCIANKAGMTREEEQERIDLFTEACHIAGMSVTQSLYGRVRVRVPRCKIHSMRKKRVYPMVCPVVHRARMNDMARLSYDVKMLTEKGKKQRAAAESKSDKKQAPHVLGPKDFPRLVKVSTSYTKSECCGMRLPDGSYYEPTQDQEVYMTWAEYEARKELKVKYRVDFRIKKSKKRKSKGGSGGGKAFTMKSESSVFKSVAGRK